MEEQIVKIVCPKCKTHKHMEVVDGEEHPGMSLDVWECGKCKLQQCICVVIGKGKYIIEGK